MIKRLKTIVSIITIAAVAITVGLYNISISQAASLTGLSDALGSYVINAATNHQIDFTTPTGATNGQTILVTFPAGFGLTSITEDDIDFESPAATDLTTAPDCTGSEQVGVGISGQVITFTLCAGDGGSVAAAATVRISIGTNATASGTGANQITNPSSANSYSISIGGGTFADSGSVAVPIITNEQVSVSGTVDPSISFLIQNSADTATTSSCALGTLATGSVSTCAYRLAIATNATNGFTAKITSDGDLNTSGGDAIDAIAEDGTVTAGTEGYGIAVTGATTGLSPTGGVTEAGNFSDDDTPIPTSATNIVTAAAPYAYTALTLTSSTLVTHRAAISAITEAGSYDQVVTYTVTGSF